MHGVALGRFGAALNRAQPASLDSPGWSYPSMLKDRGKEVNPARRKETSLQISARNAARSSRLGRSSSLLLWVLALSEAPEALGRIDPGRADPDYALARYLQPCKSVSECGARQFCTSGRCGCPSNLGLMGGPQCTTTNKVRQDLMCHIYVSPG
jgi:hypothetical protein